MSKQPKRFLLFGGDIHYSGGGFGSFLSSHSSSGLAFEEATRRMAWDWPPGTEDFDPELCDKIEWFHVFDCDERVVVGGSAEQSYGDALDIASHA